MAARTMAQMKWKPASCARNVGVSAAVVLGVLSVVLISACPVVRRGEVDAGVRRELAGHAAVLHLLLGDPRGESSWCHHLPSGVHVPVPQPAELGAADLEGADLRGLEEGDVVVARDRVGLDP